MTSGGSGRRGGPEQWAGITPGRPPSPAAPSQRPATCGRAAHRWAAGVWGEGGWGASVGRRRGGGVGPARRGRGRAGVAKRSPDTARRERSGRRIPGRHLVGGQCCRIGWGSPRCPGNVNSNIVPVSPFEPVASTAESIAHKNRLGFLVGAQTGRATVGVKPRKSRRGGYEWW